MQLPPTHLFAEPRPEAPLVYDIPPVIVRRRPVHDLLARLRRTPAAAEAPACRRLATDEPSLAPGPR